MTVAHNIDVLVQAHTGGFDKKLKDSEKRTKEFADKAKPWLEGIFGKGGAGLANSFLTGGALAAGASVALSAINALTGAIRSAFTAFQQLVADGFNDLDQLGDMAKRLSLSAAALTTLQLAAIKSGSSAEDLNASIQRMTKNLAEAADGGGPVNAALAEIGLTAQELTGLSLEDKFKKIADGMAGITDSGKRLSIIGDIFGKTGFSLNELLAGGGKSIDEFRAKASKLGLLFSDGEVAKVGDAVDSWESAGMALSGLGQSFAVALAPLAIGLGDLLTDNIGGITEALHPVFELIREWTPVLIQMSSITSQVFTSIMQLVWQFRDVFVAVFGGPIALLLWKTGENAMGMAEQISIALAFTESFLARFGQWWKLASYEVTLAMVTIGNDALNMFTTVLPNLFINFASATLDTFSNLAHNIGQVFAYMWDQVVTFGNSDMELNFSNMFDGFKVAAMQAAKDMARAPTALENELRKGIAEQSKTLAFDTADDVAKRMKQLKDLITDSDADFSGGGFGDTEMTVTTKLAPGALERGSSAAFEAIVNAQQQQADPVVAAVNKVAKNGDEANRHLAEIAQQKNKLQFANL